MKRKISVVVLFLLSQICFAQIGIRKSVRGQVVNDSVNVENVVVFNVNSKTGTVTGSQGFFKIDVKNNDTLIFSGLQFKSKKIVYSDIKNSLKIKLEAFAYQLSEVIVSKSESVKAIQGSQEIVDQQYFDDEKSSPQNRTMMQTGGIENPMDFARMYKDVLRIIKKDTFKNTKEIIKTDFTEVAMRKIPYTFFNSTLQLRDDEIKLFLVFCENDDKVQKVLKSKSEFEIMDFLINKNIEFKKITNFDK